MTISQHVTIVGGGAIGLSLAWELSRRGLRVTLMDRTEIGRGTSWASAGLLPPGNPSTATDPIDQLRGLSHQLFPEWAKTLQSVTGIDCGFRRCGGWYLANTPGERAVMLGMTRYWKELEIECESVSQSTLAAREPALANWIGQQHGLAWWVPSESQIRPPRYLRALAKACRDSGVVLCEQSIVTDIRSSDNHAEVLVNGSWHRSDSIIVSSGAWAGQISKAFRLEHSIIPVRGQMLLLKTEAPLLRSTVNVGHRYVLCRDDGYTLVGSNEEETGFELGTTDDVLRSLHEFSISLVPELAGAQWIKSWSGLRPMTFDGFPMIGRVPRTSNLYIAAGHFRGGLHQSPGTAVLLADLITGTPPAIDLTAFRVGKQQSPIPLGTTIQDEQPE